MPRFVPKSVLVLLAGLGGLSPNAALAAGDPEMLKVVVDHARVLRVDRPAETVIIGNPSIVDVTIHDSRTLVLTGKSFGITNIVILDGEGRALLDESVAVTSFETGTVRVYRQAQRVTYACAPECEPSVTIGDETGAFASAIGQYKDRQSMATAGQQ